MKRAAILASAIACTGILFWTISVNATEPPARAPACTWAQSVQLCRSRNPHSCYGYKQITPEQRGAFFRLCYLTRQTVHQRRIPYRYRTSCRRYDNDTWMCIGTLSPIRRSSPTGEPFPTRHVFALSRPGSFLKNMINLRNFIREWSN